MHFPKEELFKEPENPQNHRVMGLVVWLLAVLGGGHGG